MNKKKKVLVAISGGVDSSAVAFLLKEEGYEVMGIFMRLGGEYQESETAARKVCDYLGIKFFPVNINEQFEKEIVDYFVSSYQQGTTPNPCVRCNKLIKFGELLKWREKLGADMLATGHYVKNIYNKETGEHELYRGEDKTKDQSYFLYNLGQSELKVLLFPLGGLKKIDIKQMVKEEGIPVLKKESMDICFLHENGRAVSQSEYLKDKIALKSGPIKVVTTKKENGKRVTEEVGEHKGLPLYTLGQRKGVEIGGTGPYYVAGMSYPQNTLYVVKDSEDELLMVKKAYLKDSSFVSEKCQIDTKKCQAVIRYRHNPVDCSVHQLKSKELIKLANNKAVKELIFQTEFDISQRAVTAGQSIVWYERDKLLGGGIIDEITYRDFSDNVV